jgi:hypothetical protein
MLFHVISSFCAEEDHQGMSPALSQCARFVPRFGGAVRRFALRPLPVIIDINDDQW